MGKDFKNNLDENNNSKDLLIKLYKEISGENEIKEEGDNETMFKKLFEWLLSKFRKQEEKLRDKKEKIINLETEIREEKRENKELEEKLEVKKEKYNSLKEINQAKENKILEQIIEIKEKKDEIINKNEEIRKISNELTSSNNEKNRLNEYLVKEKSEKERLTLEKNKLESKIKSHEEMLAKYNSLSTEHKSYIDRYIVSTDMDTFKISGGKEASVENLWEYIKNEIINENKNEINKLIEIFNYFFDLAKKINPKLDYQKLNIGDKFITDKHIRLTSGKSSGNIEEILLLGYEKNGKIVKKSIVKL